MATLLIVDPLQHSRLGLQFDLVHSGQFERVLACEGLAQAQSAMQRCAVQVMLLSSALELEQGDLALLLQQYPTVGLVLVHENGASVLAQSQPLVHAHIQRTASVMEAVAGIAKALVVCRATHRYLV